MISRLAFTSAEVLLLWKGYSCVPSNISLSEFSKVITGSQKYVNCRGHRVKTQVICEQVGDGWEQWVLGPSKDNLLLYGDAA